MANASNLVAGMPMCRNAFTVLAKINTNKTDTSLHSIHYNTYLADSTKVLKQQVVMLTMLNPYAYVPSSKDLKKFAKWLEDLSDANYLEGVALVGNGSWPLPWYLRTIEDLTYWPNIRIEFSEYTVVFVMPEHAEKADRLLPKPPTLTPWIKRKCSNYNVFTQ